MQVLKRHISILYLYEGAECAVCRIVCDQEPHVFVAQFHWSRTIHGGQGTFSPTQIIFINYIDNILSEKPWNHLKRGILCKVIKMHLFGFFFF